MSAKLSLGELGERKLIKRNKADTEWAKAVKEKYHNRCAFCNNTKRLNAHHIIPVEFKQTRLEVENGIALCPRHHKWGMFSAHKNPIWFISALEKKDILQLNRLFELADELYTKSDYKK